MSDYDVVVIGAGPGGYEAAFLLGKEGKKVAIIEKNERGVGGTCLNEGCVPAKQYLESAGYIAKRDYFCSCGVEVGEMTLDIKALKNKKMELIEQLRDGIHARLKRAKVDIIMGTAQFESRESVSVDGRSIKADKFIIATGSRHRPHPLLEVDGRQIISSREVFELDSAPKSLLIVGGGAIGCEFATFFSSIGTAVHMVEFASTIVPAEDADVAKTLKRELEKKGITISVDTIVTGYSKFGDTIEVGMQTKKGEERSNYDQILVSIGRIPYIDELGLDIAGVYVDSGFVKVDSTLRTSNPNIYAIGDTISTPALAHSAYNEAAIVTKNICHGSQASPSKLIPFVTFCQPQVASVGQNEKMLKAKGIEYRTIKQFYKSSTKAKIKGDDSGFVKLLCDKESGIILGGSMIGNDTTEHIHQILIAISAEVGISELAEMVFAHPTLSESLWEMVQE